MTKELEEKIILMYESNLSASKIAEKIGKSKNGVLYVLHKYNIDTANRKYDNRKNLVNDHYFDKIDTQEKAYILGMLMADGNIMDNNIIQLSLEKTDYELLKHIALLINYTGEIRFKENKYCILYFTSEQMCTSLKKYNIVPRKSLILQPPNISDKLYRHMVRGYFDGDGSIWFDKSVEQYGIQFVGTKEVLSDFKDKMNWKDNKLRLASKTSINTYRLGYRGNILVSSMLDELYEGSTIYMERKYKKYIQCKELKELKEKNKKQIWINNLGL